MEITKEENYISGKHKLQSTGSIGWKNFPLFQSNLA